LIYKDVRGLGAGDVRVAEGDDASAPAGAKTSEAELPDGWEKIYSEEHGRHYYWHRPTKESSWEHPAGGDAGDEEADSEGALPEGWEKHFDAENNQWYYWNTQTKETSWDRPGAVPAAEEPAAEQEEAAPEQAEEEEEEDEDPDASAVLAQRRVWGEVLKWQGFFGWIIPEKEDVSKDLRPLLESQQDKIYLNWREVPEGVELKAGSPVSFLVYADDNGLGASDIRLRIPGERKEQPEEADVPEAPWKKGKGKGKKNADPLAKLERQWAKQDKQLGFATSKPSAGGRKRPAADMEEDLPPASREGPLLPGWEEQWSAEHGCHYYWHTATKQSSWDRPSMPLDDDEEEEMEAEAPVPMASKAATPLTPLMSRPGRTMTPVTPASRTKAGQSALAKDIAALNHAEAAAAKMIAPKGGGKGIRLNTAIHPSPKQPASKPPKGAFRPTIPGKGPGKGPSAAARPTMVAYPREKTPWVPIRAPMGKMGRVA